MARSFLRAAVLALLVLPLVVYATTYEARVVSVADGDTVTVLTTDNEQVRIRLAEIDAPEGGQPWSRKATDALKAMVADKTVLVVPIDTDVYGRTVARLYVDGVDVNAALVRDGHAWVYRRYANDQTLYVLETAARERGIGLWGLPENERQPPWEWRAGGAQELADEDPGTGRVIGNRRSMVFHLPLCPSYNQVSEQNRVYFETPEDAEAAGFRMAGNC
jgi:endonuclease YncB( thermonuclease family)